MKTLHLTDEQYSELMYFAEEGIEQIFGYTNPEVDWSMTDEEFDAWQDKANDMMRAVAANAE